MLEGPPKPCTIVEQLLTQKELLQMLAARKTDHTALHKPWMTIVDVLTSMFVPSV